MYLSPPLRLALTVVFSLLCLAGYGGGGYDRDRGGYNDRY